MIRWQDLVWMRKMQRIRGEKGRRRRSEVVEGRADSLQQLRHHLLKVLFPDFGAQRSAFLGFQRISRWWSRGDLDHFRVRVVIGLGWGRCLRLNGGIGRSHVACSGS
jgi:hypothetical protein